MDEVARASDVRTDLHNLQAAALKREQKLATAIERLAHAIRKLGEHMDGGLPNDVRNAVGQAQSLAQSSQTPTLG